MSLLKHLLTYMPASIQDAYLKRKDSKQLVCWQEANRPFPVPHIVKQNVIKAYQHKYNVRTLFETGTYLGDMVWAQRNNFEKIYSIELSEQLFQKAKKRFSSFPYIHILQGDSGKVLHSLSEEMNERSIFWLDGHYSGGVTAKGDSECPIFGELSAIFKSKKEHVLLIDDARCFVGENDYPTLEVLTDYVKGVYPNSVFEVEDDIIKIELKF